MSLLDRAIKWMEVNYLPNVTWWERYKTMTNRQKIRYWVCNWPGFSFRNRWFRISILEWYEGHPWSRIYISTKNTFTFIDPFDLRVETMEKRVKDSW